MLKRRFQLIAILCCLLIGLTACSRKWAVIGAAAAAAGAGTYAYVKGDLKRSYEASMDKSWQAAVQSVEELKLTTDGKSFTINVKRLGENMTEVGVRIGTFGDRTRSEAIHDKILSKL